ncbi:MAG: hypothetical protein FJ224_07950 [Lentisphaerae bacterium]|nr:hypothetical protein [Lentisphaerota bacterium]
MKPRRRSPRGMAFQKAGSLPGMILVPACARGPHKHDCPDCIECQWCDDSRCSVCLAAAGKRAQRRGCKRRQR